jgi:prevent-host-death family protein
MGTTVNIHEAKTHLSRLIEQAEQGEQVIIARAGKPVIQLTPFKPAPPRSRLGFLKGYDFHVPEDFNEMGRQEIETAIYGDK